MEDLKNIIESVFDEKDNLKGIDNEAEFHLLKKFKDAHKWMSNQYRDQLGQKVDVGDYILVSNDAFSIKVGKIIRKDRGSKNVLVCWNGESDKAWWFEPWKGLKINKKIFDEIMKLS